MGLIKSPNTPASLSAFSMTDIEKTAKAIILRARRQAEQLLIEAQKEVDAMKAAGRADGLAAGCREGQARGLEEGRKAGHDQALGEHRDQLTRVVQTLTTTATELDAARCELETQAVRAVIELAIAIAERVTKRIGLLDAEVVMENVAEAMKLVVHTADLRIAVNPAQKAALADALPRLRLEWPVLEHVELVEDASLAPGGCRLHTRRGVIDADLDVQIRNIAADLLPDEKEGETAI